MPSKHKSTPFKSLNLKDKDKKLVLKNIRQKVEKGTGLTLKQLWTAYNEEQLFYVGLQHVTTTKKAFCAALNIPVEAGCRYKRHFEDREQLVQSTKEIVCPFTKHLAHEISTNPNEFDRLKDDPQTRLL